MWPIRMGSTDIPIKRDRTNWRAKAKKSLRFRRVATTIIVPDVPMGSHTASLGLAFYTADQFPAKFKNGAFMGQHGSWNRAEFAGYRVMFVPFGNGKPEKPQDFLTGFIADEEAGEVYGRPVGVTIAPDGSLLVNDDDSGILWRVAVK